MNEGKNRILSVLNSFSGRDGEPKDDSEKYILNSMWVMMMSEFEASVKTKVEKYIDSIKRNNISDIHVCLLVKNFYGKKDIELTINKIVNLYKKNTSDISYENFTRDRVPKYKSQAIEKLFNSLGLFFSDEEKTQLDILNGLASTRDSIAHGDIGIQITRNELETNLVDLEELTTVLDQKLEN